MTQHQISINDVEEILHKSEIDIPINDLEFLDEGGQKVVF